MNQHKRYIQCCDIIQHYQNFDGFIVLHGTDTMAYTSSALSFMLENLGKPVVLTGSQIPLSEPESDAVDNLLGSILVAGNCQIAEVMIFFANKLIRGNRARKQSTEDMDAFFSPNFPILANLQENQLNIIHFVSKIN